MTLTSPFARRVAGVFASRVARFVIGLAISFLLARILLPSGRGQYALLTLIPGMLMALGQLGLPSAISFFAGRGRSGRDLERLALVLAIGLSLVFVALTALLLPWLTSTILTPAPADLLVVSLTALPFQFVAAFTGAALIGRQRMRNYNLILVAQSLVMLTLVVVLVGVLGLGVAGAAYAYATVGVLTAVATGIELRRMVREEAADPERRPESPISAPQLVGYGLRIYPASVTGYFSYRSDVLLLSAFLGDPAAIGLYTFAVSLAELTFFIPDSVSTVFFPRIASMERERADALAPQVSRFTVLVTALAALALIPAAIFAVGLVLPDYLGSITPFLVIMPGIVALSISKVLSGYLGGLGLPLSVAGASGANLAINLAANVVLIPMLGIVGAATASLVSYAAHATLLVVIAARLSRRRPLEFVIPGGAEVRRLANGLLALWRRLRPPARA
jgi:O-antigen/teichoic acid export membrane protein